MTPLNTRKSSSGDVVLESRHLIGLFMVMVVIFGVVFVLGYELGRNQYTQQVHASTPATDEPSTTSELVKSPSVVNAPASSGKQPSADQKNDLKADAEAPAKDWDFYKSSDNKSPAPLEKPAKAAPPLSPTQKISGSAQPPSTISPVKPSASGKSSAAVQSVSGKSPATVSPAPAKPVATIAASKSSASSKPQSMDAPLLPRGTILLQVAALVKQSDALAMAEVLEQKKFPTVIVPPGADKFYHVQVGPFRSLEAAISARNALENAGFKSIIKR